MRPLFCIHRLTVFGVVAFFVGGAGAQEVWETELGDVAFEFTLGDWIVWSFSPLDTAGTGGIFINVPGGTVSAETAYQGYWMIYDGSEAPCSDQRFDIEGNVSNNHGSLEINFTEPGPPFHWSAQRGLCSNPETEGWSGIPKNSKTAKAENTGRPDASADTGQQEEASRQDESPDSETPSGKATTAPAADEAERVWKVISETEYRNDRDYRSDLEVFVETFPNSFFARLARARLAEIGSTGITGSPDGDDPSAPVREAATDTAGKQRGWLGVTIQAVSEDNAESLGLDNAQGVLVSGIAASGPAEAAGLQPGDVVLKFEEMDLAGPRDLARAVSEGSSGQSVVLEVYREGEKRAIAVVLGNREENNETSAAAGTAGDEQASFVATEEPEPLSEPDNVVLRPRIVPVGKWPEGVVWDGRSIWVAESGQRRIARVDLNSGQIADRVKVGRLPVQLLATNGGDVINVVVTDHKIWFQPTRGKGRTIARLPDYPRAATASDQAVWVLGWIDGSSERTRVTRADLNSGKTRKSEVLPANGSDVVLDSIGTLWSIHEPPGSSESILFGFEASSLEARVKTTLSGRLVALAANDFGIFAAGTDNAGPVVVKFDSQSGDEIARLNVAGNNIHRLIADYDSVIAADTAGNIYILSPEDLSLKRTIRLDFDFGDSYPNRMHVFDDILAVTTHSGQGENGSLLLVSDWRP